MFLFCSYISGGNFLSSKNKKRSLWNFLLYFGKWNFLVSKNLIKLFSTLKISPLGETGCLRNLSCLLAAQTSRFLIHPLSQTQSVRPHLVAFTSLRSICVTYGTPWHCIGHQVLPSQPMPREAEDFRRGGKYFNHVFLLT